MNLHTTSQIPPSTPGADQNRLTRSGIANSEASGPSQDAEFPTFSTAAAAWFAEHKRHIKPSTADCYADALNPLCKFLGDRQIDEIQNSHIRFYQQLRKARVGTHAINREVGVLQQVMREFGEWGRLEKHYRQLEEPPQRAGHSLTPEEEQHLREVAFSRPEWHLAAHCMMVMLSTAMGFEDMRKLRRRDVNMKRGSVTIREGALRTRTAPLNDAARESMTWILKRWKKLGGCDPEQYLLPRRPRGRRTHWTLDEPMLTIYGALRCIREAADLQYFRVGDCRAQAAKLLRDGTVQGQHLSERSDNDRSPGAMGSLISFPGPGGAA